MVKRLLASVAAELPACCAPRAKARAQSTRPYAPFFKALADETRLEILGLLAGSNEPVCACEIEANFDLSQPTISHHLKILRETGLISGERRGTWIYYALEREALKLLPDFCALLEG